MYSKVGRSGACGCPNNYRLVSPAEEEVPETYGRFGARSPRSESRPAQREGRKYGSGRSRSPSPTRRTATYGSGGKRQKGYGQTDPCAGYPGGAEALYQLTVANQDAQWMVPRRGARNPIPGPCTRTVCARIASNPQDFDPTVYQELLVECSPEDLSYGGRRPKGYGQAGLLTGALLGGTAGYLAGRSRPKGYGQPAVDEEESDHEAIEDGEEEEEEDYEEF